MPDLIEVESLVAEGLTLEDESKNEHIARPADASKDNVDENRGAFERDYSRLLHCSSFRRLQRKLQLLPHGDSDYYRTRLTHSLEVSQIAEGVAKRIRHKDKANVVDGHLLRFACLAHDIGNPPFGHAGEKVLNKLMENHGGFEGNGQTYRIIRRLEQRSLKFEGLNPTAAARMAVVKYCVPFDTAKARAGTDLPSKFLYPEDFAELMNLPSLKARTLTAQIMDCSDDIAYATHDLEDARKAGLITMDDLRQAVKHAEQDKKIDAAVVENLKNAQKAAEEYAGTRAGQVAQKALTSKVVGMLIADVGIVELSSKDQDKYGTKMKHGVGFQKLGALVKVLKETAHRIVVGNPEVGAYELRGGLAITNLFLLLTNEPKHASRLLPDHLQLMLEKKIDTVHRLVCDYLAGMTEDFLLRLHNELLGEGLPPLKVK